MFYIIYQFFGRLHVFSSATFLLRQFFQLFPFNWTVIGNNHMRMCIIFDFCQCSSFWTECMGQNVFSLENEFIQERRFPCFDTPHYSQCQLTIFSSKFIQFCLDISRQTIYVFRISFIHIGRKGLLNSSHFLCQLLKCLFLLLCCMKLYIHMYASLDIFVVSCWLSDINN